MPTFDQKNRLHPVFIDCEFTGFSQHEQLLSIALIMVKPNGNLCFFYGYTSEYDPSLVSDWHQHNVIANLSNTASIDFSFERPFANGTYFLGGSFAGLRESLLKWLSDLTSIYTVRFWADVAAHDAIWLQRLIAPISSQGGLPQFPQGTNCIVHDLATLLEIKGIDPDRDRVQLAGQTNRRHLQHHALFDAFCSYKIYEQLMLSK